MPGARDGRVTLGHSPIHTRTHARTHSHAQFKPERPDGPGVGAGDGGKTLEAGAEADRSYQRTPDESEHEQPHAVGAKVGDDLRCFAFVKNRGGEG